MADIDFRSRSFSLHNHTTVLRSSGRGKLERRELVLHAQSAMADSAGSFSKQPRDLLAIHSQRRRKLRSQLSGDDFYAANLNCAAVFRQEYRRISPVVRVVVRGDDRGFYPGSGLKTPKRFAAAPAAFPVALKDAHLQPMEASACVDDSYQCDDGC